jgi:hypothetical protein
MPEDSLFVNWNAIYADLLIDPAQINKKKIGFAIFFPNSILYMTSCKHGVCVLQLITTSYNPASGIDFVIVIK